MTIHVRKLMTVVVLFTALLPAMRTVSAENTLDGSACWKAGSLTISGAEMSWDVPPATIIDPTQAYNATLQTSAGTIELALDPVAAPIATNNFICLALAGFYTGSDFHRIAAGTLIQGGDPSGTGVGGPSYTIPSDPSTGEYQAGSVAMSNSAPDQNGSQFFVAVTDLTGLIPNQYPVFGHVTSGMEVVQAISEGAVQANVSGEQSQPVDPTILLNVTITAGTPETTPAGPSLTSPTATTAAVLPTATTAAAVPTPTPASASSDAQARPGSSTAGIVPTAASGTTADAGGCTGVVEYETAFDDAYTTAAVANPIALAFLVGLQQSDSTGNMFEQMTPEQATAMSSFYYALSDGVAAITPPAFVTEWHQVQIEIFRALGDFTADIASQGLTIAMVQASPVLGALSTQSDAALASAGAACADFLAWASGEAASAE